MVRRTLRAKNVDAVVVATDDERVAAAAAAAGADVVMTSAALASGTDRVAEAAASLRAEIVINVQGDQPLASAEDVEALVTAIRDRPEVGAATLAAPLLDDRDWWSPDVVKVVVGSDGRAIYFSRAPVPFWAARGGSRPAAARKHCGVYGFRREVLLRYASWPASELERLESLEQLRLLERGVPMVVLPASGDWVSVDRPEDLPRIEAALGEPARKRTASAPVSAGEP